MNPSGTVNLRDIVPPELEAVGAENGRNFTVEGLVVPLPSREAQTMAMTIHELTTNAAKYGALKADNGQIEIRWRTYRRNDRTYLTFEWRERGVRIEELAPARGFGAKVRAKFSAHVGRHGGATLLPMAWPAGSNFHYLPRARERHDG